MVTNVFIHAMLAILLPPLLIGVIARTKALCAGRSGAPLLQPYYDIARLWNKGSVFSSTTTWVFRAGPLVSLAVVLTAALLIPFGAPQAPFSFRGDMLLFLYLFALARFFTIIAALDTGSSFEGMGSAREATFACLAEPALLFSFLALAKLSGSFSLTGMLAHRSVVNLINDGAPLLMLLGGLYVIILAENCRIPFDDPNTHLELTMIHEVMVLDHSGPLFGIILYGAAVKLFVLGALLIHIAFPISSGYQVLDWGVFVCSQLLLAITIGLTESLMARLRLVKIPYLLAVATILTAFGLLLVLR
ncbi:NADH-quinone oxidoreductase subunit H [Geobacter pelophilus]|uniref:NADH-quinone oxidoreductase subunit H n=1 Tax=Geoanaerobacter pelophilus TaxID=60036 RepID=A0AAW4L9S2_9BACT|nr:NADH-quinone oxidoreductase subunit H [Geoanaerobacter pelophilus]MBT0665813.1 NADH-quinone oxidoreductase subunit H [Geoanaerobacter pelophilus]